VKSGKEEPFTKAWSEVTRAFVESCGALGSRLHATDKNVYIAYAQWPSREIRDAADLPEHIKKGAFTEMRDCCNSVETLFEMTPTADLLKLFRATDT
jgi:hypothetical protein